MKHIAAFVIALASILLIVWSLAPEADTAPAAPKDRSDQETQSTKAELEATDRAPLTDRARQDPLGTAMQFNSENAAPAEGSGDPDLGRFETMLDLQAAAKSLAMTFAKDGDWAEEQMRWQVEIEGQELSFDSAPLDLLCPDCNPSDQARAAARQLDAELTRLIEDQANYAHGVLELSAQDYVQNSMQRIPRTSRTTIVKEGDPPRKKARYEAFSSIHTGKWTYVIAFRSTDYPELEAAMDQLANLRTQRRQEVVAILGG